MVNGTGALHMKSLAVDFNNVLAAATEATRVALEEVTGLVIPAEEFSGKTVIAAGTKFGLRGKKKTNQRRAITPDDWAAAKALVYSPHFYRLTKPLPGVAEALVELAKREVKVHVVSSAGGLTEAVVRKWLGIHGLVVSTVTTGIKDKRACYDRCDAAVDDNPDHLISLVDTSKARSVLITGGLTEETEELHPSIYPARSLLEAISYLDVAA
jgi:phosphoglycolate phosphatase-like HAD superfamily hydrolase